MFIRINDSMAVSIYHIDNIRREYLVLAGETKTIGRPYYLSVLEQLNVIGKE